MSDLSDDDISRERPTEADDDRDTGSAGQDTGDEPTERYDDLDQGGEGDLDTGDEA